MHLMSVSPCKVDPDVWMHEFITHYQCILVCVNDVMLVGKEVHHFFLLLMNVVSILRVSVLGSNGFPDSDGNIAWGSHFLIPRC
jgi:hypothetical protein